MFRPQTDLAIGFPIADVDSATVDKTIRGTVFTKYVTLAGETSVGRADWRSLRPGDLANQMFWRLDPNKPPSRGSVVGSYSSSIPSSPSKGEWLPLRKPRERDEDYQGKPSSVRDSYNEGVFASYGYGGSKLPGKAEYLVSATVGHGDRVPMAFGGGGPLVAQHRGPDLHDYSIWVWDIDQNGDLGIGSPLHSAFHVRKWPESFCAGKTTSSDPITSVNQVALQFTKSEKDNTGWGAVHHASKDGVLSAEAFGPIRDGAPKHNIIDNVFREAIDIDRAVFGDGTDLWSAPIQFTRSRWRRGRKGPIITNPQLRMDPARLHPHNCGKMRQGMWDWEDYAFLTDWSDPTAKREDDGGPNKSPTQDPGGVKKPTGDPPDTIIDPGGYKGEDGWPVNDIDYPAPWGEVDNTIDGVAGGPAELESPSEYGHPRPNGPDSADNKRDNPTYSSNDPRGEIDAFWLSRYGFTEREFLNQPITHHGMAGAVYDSATRGNGPEGWTPVFSQVPEIEELPDGVLWRKKAGLGSGHYTFAPANIRLHHIYSGASLPSDALDYSVGVFAANGQDTRFGMGQRLPNSAFFARGMDISLDFSNDPDAPNILITSRDETGAQGTGDFDFVGGSLKSNGVTVGTGSGNVSMTDENDTDNAVIRADGTSGRNIQKSGVLIDDSDNVSGIGALSTTSIELGHASDTTLSRSSAGVVAVEGNVLLRGDLNLSDVESAATARTNLKVEELVARATAAGMNIASVAVVNAASASVTIADRDTFEFHLKGAIVNNSGAARTYTARVTVGATTFDLAFDGTIAASATNHSHIEIMAEVAIHSSSLIYCTIRIIRGTASALGTAANNVLAQDRRIVRTSTNNEIGASKTVAIGLFSSSATATQTFYLTNGVIRR